MVLAFRPTIEEVAVIDRLVTECGAASRSELVAIVLDAFLPHIKNR